MISSATVASVGACVGSPGPDTDDEPSVDGGTATGSGDGGRPPNDARTTDAMCGDAGYAVMYDTYAQALYLDGTYGPLTGIIRADYVIAGVALQLDFWHGHNDSLHQFTVTADHFEALKRGEKVTIETTFVDDHQHTLFIDPMDPDYRVEGAAPVTVPLGDC
jgi:hypothetical protein